MANHFLREFISRLVRGENLTRNEAAQLLDGLLDADATDGQIGAVLAALASKGETVDELTGMAQSLRDRRERANSAHLCFIDPAGPGSSRAKTFNVPPGGAFVIAGGGLPVAKHGNRA